MSDIVERLRQTKGSSNLWPDAEHGRVLINPDGPEAANEIERLRAENLTLRNHGLNAQEEIERLRAELAEERAKPKLTINRVERKPLVITDD